MGGCKEQVSCTMSICVSKVWVTRVDYKGGFVFKGSLQYKAGLQYKVVVQYEGILQGCMLHG